MSEGAQVLDAEGRPRRKSKVERILEGEIRTLSDRREELSHLKEHIAGLLKDSAAHSGVKV